MIYMSYCNKCGREIPEGSLCTDCKIEHLDSKIEKHKKTNWILIGVISLLIIGALYFFVFKSGNVINNLANEDKTCPYECCGEGSGFLVKPCQDLYRCEESKCKAIDSDGDGLTDIKENEIGTDPTKQNTDNDRYNDNEDPNPLTTNSAKIDVFFLSKSWDWKYGNIVLAMIGGSIINPDMIIVEPKAYIQVNNNGDDYTNFVDFNILFKISDTLISQKAVHINKFNAGDQFQEIYIQPIKAGEIPDLLINLVKQQTNDWGIEIQNLNYEKFS